MTRLPTESWNIEAMTGEMFPSYRVKPMCAHPGCSKFVDHIHHIVRRSFIGGDVAWVKYENGDIVGNLVGLCYKHHEKITKNEARMVYDESSGRFVWLENGVPVGFLYPPPPKHGQKNSQNETGEPDIIGPGSAPICPGCNRPLPHEHDKKKREPAKRRKTWTIQVPDEAEEDGALVLDTLVEEVAQVFGRAKNKNLRYYVVAQALALILQNKEFLA